MGKPKSPDPAKPTKEAFVQANLPPQGPDMTKPVTPPVYVDHGRTLVADGEFAPLEVFG